MEIYDYKEAMRKDIHQYLEENWKEGKRIEDKDRDTLYDDMFDDDGVTGNGSGSYTFDSFKAEEYVCHNLNLLGEALDEFCVDGNTLREKMSGEWADVTIRCYLMGQLLDDVIEEWNSKIDGQVE